MSDNHSELWAALYEIGNEEPTVPDISALIVAKLIDLKVVERKATGLPILTDYGRQCFNVMESGQDVYIAGLDDPQLKVALSGDN